MSKHTVKTLMKQLAQLPPDSPVEFVMEVDEQIEYYSDNVKSITYCEDDNTCEIRL